jgi:hypothetical protein
VDNLQTEIARSDLQESAQVINAIVKVSINIDDPFDERTLLNKVIQNQTVGCGSSSIEEKWQAIFKVFSKD